MNNLYKNIKTIKGIYNNGDELEIRIVFILDEYYLQFKTHFGILYIEYKEAIKELDRYLFYTYSYCFSYIKTVYIGGKKDTIIKVLELFFEEHLSIQSYTGYLYLRGSDYFIESINNQLVHYYLSINHLLHAVYRKEKFIIKSIKTQLEDKYKTFGGEGSILK